MTRTTLADCALVESSLIAPAMATDRAHTHTHIHVCSNMAVICMFEESAASRRRRRIDDKYAHESEREREREREREGRSEQASMPREVSRGN